MCVLLNVQKQLQAGAYKLMHKLHNIFPMNIIINGLSCNFFEMSCKNEPSVLHNNLGWQVLKEVKIK